MDKLVDIVLVQMFSRDGIVLPQHNPLLSEYVNRDRIAIWVGNALYAKDGLKESIDYLFPSILGEAWNEMMDPTEDSLNAELSKGKERKKKMMKPSTFGNSSKKDLNEALSAEILKHAAVKLKGKNNVGNVKPLFAGKIAETRFITTKYHKSV